MALLVAQGVFFLLCMLTCTFLTCPIAVFFLLAAVNLLFFLVPVRALFIKVPKELAPPPPPPPPPLPPSSSRCSSECFFFAAFCKAACKASCMALGGSRVFAALQEPLQPGNAPQQKALPPSRQTLALTHSTKPASQQPLTPIQSSLAQPMPTADPMGRGTDSLRSSDEFPANKENSDGQWPPLERPAAPVVKAVATACAGADAPDLVSEQVLAQEAVYALQV